MKKRYLKHSPKKVVLLGMGPSVIDYMGETLTQEFSPDFCDEVWSINMASNCFHTDVVFWLDDLQQQKDFKPGLMEVLKRRNKPVITCKAYPDIVPKSYDYPLDQVSRISTPIFGKPYLNNGVAMAIGYAIYKEVETLKLYGCDFTYPNRNFAETGRACVESWLTLAIAKNDMAVQIAPKTSLFDAAADGGIYGYSEQPTVDLGNGTKLKYVSKSEAKTLASYAPEDSSGKKGIGGPKNKGGTVSK